MHHLSQNIQDAYKIVTESGIPEELHRIAFQWTLENLTASLEAKSNSTEHAASIASSDIASLAAKLGISLEQAEDMFEISEDSVSLTISSKQLPKSKSQATRAIALLIGMANAELFKKQTSYDEVRHAADYLGCLDVSNFSKQMKQLDSLIKIKGSGRKAEFSLKQPGREEAMVVAQELQEK